LFPNLLSVIFCGLMIFLSILTCTIFKKTFNPSNKVTDCLNLMLTCRLCFSLHEHLQLKI
jgi:hypothetical protein